MYDMTQRLIHALALTLVAAAVVAGGAQGALRPDDRAGTIGVGGTASTVLPDAVDRAVGNMLRTGAVRPDDAAAARGPGVFFTAPTHVVASDGFEWDDAAYGGAFVFAAVLLTVAALSVRRRRPLPH